MEILKSVLINSSMTRLGYFLSIESYSRPLLQQVASSAILVGLLPGGGAKVRPIEVVVTTSVLLAVLIQRSLVCSECSLSQLKCILALLSRAKAELGGCLERISGLESRLEVHPVLGGISEGFLLVLRCVSVVAAHWNVLVVSY